MEQRVRSISLTVNTSGGITGMQVEEVDGATTGFTFTDLRENIPVTASDFIFTPPAGIAIIDGAAPI